MEPILLDTSIRFDASLSVNYLPPDLVLAVLWYEPIFPTSLSTTDSFY